MSLTVLNSKLCIPNIGDAIPRERLSGSMNGILQKKIATIIAPAGYGKTTLAAQIVQGLNWKSIWYRLDESDQDLLIFLNYLIAGARKKLPSFGEKILKQIDSIRESPEAIKNALVELIAALEKSVEEHLCFVLEDFHNVQNCKEIIDLLEFIFENQPSHIHWIIVSRMEPPFSFSKLRLNGELIEIKVGDIAFTEKEIALLCQKRFGISLSEEGVSKLQQKTEGWIAVLILFNYAVKNKNPAEMEELIVNLKGSSRIISTYLQENVFADLSEATQHFLLRTSILSYLQTDFCDDLLGIRNSREILAYLVSNHLFTVELDEDRDSFFYHQLFRDFLLKQLKLKIDPESTKRLHLQAAELFLAIGNIEEALNQVLKARDFNRACELYEQGVSKWHEQGQQHLIQTYLDRIPCHFLQKNLWHSAEQAYAAMMSLNFKDAIRHGEAYLNLHHSHDHEKAHQVISLLAALHFELNDIKEAELMLKTLKKQRTLSDELKVGLINPLEIYLAAFQNETRQSEKALSDFLALLERSPLNQIEREANLNLVQCRRSFITGDYDQAASFGKKALACLDKEGPGNSERIIVCCKIISQSMFYLGKFQEGLETITYWQTKYVGKGFNAVYPIEGFSMGLAANLIGMGRITEGIRKAEEGLQLFSKKGLISWQVTLHWLLSEVYIYQGNQRLAKEHIRHAIEKNSDLFHRRFYYRFFLHHIYIGQGRYDEVASFLAFVKTQKISSCEELELLVLETHYLWAGNKKNPAKKLFKKALSIMRERRRLMGLYILKPWVVDLMVDIYSDKEYETLIQNSVAQTSGSGLKSVLISLSRNSAGKIEKAAQALITFLPDTHGANLSIRLLGKFSIHLGSHVLPDNVWNSHQAKTLLKFLASKRKNGYTPREVLMELLWPNESARVSTKRLNVVLSILRKILEPELQRGTPSAYIMSNGNGYLLSIGKNGRIDIEDFSVYFEKGKKEESREKAKASFLKAESTYSGDFLLEDLHEDWCYPVREQLKNDYLFTLAWLIDYNDVEKEFDLSIEYAEKYLSADPGAESIYLRLMKLYLKINMPNRARDIFKRYKNHVIDELDCPINHEIKTFCRENQIPFEN